MQGKAMVRAKLQRLLQSRWGEALRFGMVGGVATALHYGLYLLLRLFMVAWMAYSVGYILSFLVNYYLSNVFTFHTRPTVKNGIGFTLSHVVNYLLHIVFLELFLSVGVAEVWAPFPVFACVIPINFFLVRFVLRH